MKEEKKRKTFERKENICIFFSKKKVSSTTIIRLNVVFFTRKLGYMYFATITSIKYGGCRPPRSLKIINEKEWHWPPKKFIFGEKKLLIKFDNIMKTFP